MTTSNSQPPTANSELDRLLSVKAKLEEILTNQPSRKRQLAKQLSEVTAMIDALQGQQLLF